jgi:hypothetical protein
MTTDYKAIQQLVVAPREAKARNMEAAKLKGSTEATKLVAGQPAHGRLNLDSVNEDATYRDGLSPMATEYPICIVQTE